MFLREEGNAIELFEKMGIATLKCPDAHVFQHAYGAYIPIFQLRFHRVFLAFFRAIKTIPIYRRCIKTVDPDLVYLNTSLLFPAAIASKQLRKKLIWHLREQIHPGVFGLRRAFLKWCFSKYPDAIISISKTNAKALGLPGCHIVYNSVDLNKFKPDVKTDSLEKEFQIQEKEIVVTFLGGKVNSKGAHLFVQAASLLLTKFNDLRFIIAGEFDPELGKKNNPMEVKVNKFLASRRDIREKIIFTGAIKNVVPILNRSSILVWPATVPHFSRPIMEGMILGKAVVASDFASSREILQNGLEGLLVEPSTQGLVTGITQLLNNPGQAAEMGVIARKKAIELFDEKKNNLSIISIANRL
jgi:glycosyltransferase involved in cell wall biosynthesis